MAEQASSTQFSPARSPIHRLIPIAMSLVLVAAALAKGHQLATGPVAEQDLWTSRWFLIAVVAFELFLALWLVCGFHAQLARYVALACFMLFLAVSLVKALTGDTDCGCFGNVPVHPWFTAL